MTRIYLYYEVKIMASDVLASSSAPKGLVRYKDVVLPVSEIP